MAHDVTVVPLLYIAFVIGISFIITATLTLFKLTSNEKSSQTSNLTQLLVGFIALVVVASIQSTFFIIGEEINLIQLTTILILLVGGFFLLYYSSFQREISEKIENIPNEGNKFSKLLIILTLILSIIALINFVQGNLLGNLFQGAALTTIIGFLIISIVALKDFFSEFRIIPKQILFISILIGISAIIGHVLDIPYLLGAGFMGGTSIPTAISMILLSIVVFVQDRLFKIYYKTIVSMFLIISFWFAILPRIEFELIATVSDNILVVLSPLTSVFILLVVSAYFIRCYDCL